MIKARILSILGLGLITTPMVTVSCFQRVSINPGAYSGSSNFQANKILNPSQLEEIKKAHSFKLSNEGRKKSREEINKIFDEIVANAKNNFNEVESNPNFKKYFLFEKADSIKFPYLKGNHIIEYKILREDRNGKPAIQYTVWCLDRIQNGKRLTEAIEPVFLDLP